MVTQHWPEAGRWPSGAGGQGGGLLRNDKTLQENAGFLHTA